MVTVKAATKIVLGFQDTDEKPHFDRIAYRVKGKIFATLSEEKKDINLNFSPFEQSLCCQNADPEMIHPVAGGWGRQGWTTIHLDKTDRAFLIHVLTVAYCNIAPLHLAEKYKSY